MGLLFCFALFLKTEFLKVNMVFGKIVKLLSSNSFKYIQHLWAYCVFIRNVSIELKVLIDDEPILNCS